ncbi:hypothetical protein RHMOL_Rhmol04G0355100 [Rhododendron molle]|uniref:Uncharacterized protein n=1 Tax=Rhododendron molle TaxID=49168 RepID=A0ACC0P7U1_RHOML|nr:hypothetical protein RHMOL_Rhmol04G0355100 [Rhododendron molle]
MTLSSSSSSSSSSSHPLLAVKRTSSLSTSLLRPLIPASSSADIPCFSLAAETAARPSLRPDHDPRRMEFPDRSDFELWRADGLDFEHWQVCLGGFTAGLPEGNLSSMDRPYRLTLNIISLLVIEFLRVVVGPDTRNQETLKCLLIAQKECSRRGTKWNRMKRKVEDHRNSYT